MPLAVNDDNGNITYLNKAFLNSIGHTLTEIPVLTDWWRCAYPDPQYRQTVLESWGVHQEEARRSGQPFVPLEVNIRCKDEATRTYVCSTTPIGDTISGTHLVILYDITERKRIEVAMQESERRFHRMANTAPVLIWLSTPDKLCHWFNEVWLTFTGRTMEQEVGNGWTEGVHPDDLRNCLNTYVGAFDARQDFTMEYRLRRFDGEYRWLIDNGVPRLDERGIFFGYIGSCVDITDRKNVELERNRLLTIIEDAQDFMAISDLQGRLTYLNRAGARMVGLPEDVDLSKLEIKDMHPDWGARLVLEEGIPAVLNHGFWRHENALRHANGHETPVSQVLIVHRDEHGNPVLLSTIIRDLTCYKQQEKALRDSQRRLIRAEEIAHVGHWSYEVTNHCVEWSDEMWNIFGRVPQSVELTYDTLTSWIREDFRAYHDDCMRRMLELRPGETIKDFVYCLVRPDGEQRWTETFMETEFDANSRPLRFFGVARDITESKLITEQITKNEARLSALFDAALDAVISMDAQGRITGWNRQAESMFGWSNQEAIGLNLHDTIAPSKYRAEHQTGFKRFLATGQTETLGRRIELTALRRSGEEFPVELSILPFKQNGIAHFTAFAADISARKLAEELVRKLAYYDPLTGLANRMLLNDRLIQSMMASNRSRHYGALMFIDLDNFKPANDLYGHAAGDLVLIEVAKRLKNCVRQIDTVSRIGGDEFVVLLDDLTADQVQSQVQAALLAEKVRASLADLYALNLHVDETQLGRRIEHQCSASIGVVLFLGIVQSEEEIMKSADAAMYQAKAMGRNRVYFFEAPQT